MAVSVTVPLTDPLVDPVTDPVTDPLTDSLGGLLVLESWEPVTDFNNDCWNTLPDLCFGSSLLQLTGLDFSKVNLLNFILKASLPGSI